MKKLIGLLAILIFSLPAFSQYQQPGTIVKRDTLLYSKPVGYRMLLHTDNQLYFWDKVRYKRVNAQYKVWTADVSQSSTAAPTFSAIDTTMIGAVTFTRDSTGSYKATATGKFTLNKTAVFTSGPVLVGNIPGTISILEKTVNYIRFCTTRNDTGAKTDGYLSGTTFEFRVYW